VKSKPPKGFVAWDEAVFDRLVASPPEPLVPHLRVSHALLLNVLDRPGDGFAAMKTLLTENDEPRSVQRALIRRSIAIFRSLVAAGALERLDRPDELGRRVRVTADLQSDFALDNPLSPLILEAVPRLDQTTPTWSLDVMSIVEATLENPRAVLAAQLDRVRTEALAELKAAGVEYEERIEALDKLEYPKPLREWTYDLFDAYRVDHPWAADYNIAPKSIARDLYERAMTFSEYIAHYGLTRSEGVVLRYLSDVYRGLVRNVPEDLKTDELEDLSEWLGELVRQVDSSLIDEWERLRDPAAAAAAIVDDKPPAVTGNVRAFRVLVRNALFRRVELAALRRYGELGSLDADSGWDADAWEDALSEYYEEYESIGTGADARGPALLIIETGKDRWTVRQILDDPAGNHDWAITGTVDLAASDEAGTAVLHIANVGP
jgi:hypothetical protein